MEVDDTIRTDLHRINLVAMEEEINTTMDSVRVTVVVVVHHNPPNDAEEEEEVVAAHAVATRVLLEFRYS